MDGQDLCPIGRSGAWNIVVRPVASRRSALVVLSGLPGSGRSFLLGRLGAYASRIGFRVVGADSPLSLEPTTRVGDVRRALTAILIDAGVESSVAPTGTGRPRSMPRLARAIRRVNEIVDLGNDIPELLRSVAPIVVCLDGYMPGPTLQTWLLTRLIPAIKRSADPIVLIVSGTPEQVSDLVPVADGVAALADLDANDVRRHLERLTDGLVPPLGEDEMEAYVDASVKNPSVFAAFDTLFTAVPAVGQPTVG